MRLDTVNTVILDEADEMLNMGFIEDIESILASTPAERQTLLSQQLCQDQFKEWLKSS
jgi:ATP-dependent RNA helicase DeaD